MKILYENEYARLIELDGEILCQHVNGTGFTANAVTWQGIVNEMFRVNNVLKRWLAGIEDPDDLS